MTSSDLFTTTATATVLSVVVSSIIQLWRPYFSSYLAKKGERLANAEDIDKILKELRLVTAETENIKAQIASGAWERQTLWNKRVEIYGELYGSLIQLVTRFNEVSAKSATAILLEPAGGETTGRYSEAVEKLLETQTRVITHIGYARLFAGPALDHLLGRLPVYMQLRQDSLSNPSEFCTRLSASIGQIAAEMRKEIDFDR